MKHYMSHMENESGVALITGLVILVLLTAIGTYAIHMTEIDATLSGNLKASKQALYLADAGLEWARQQISANTAVPPSPANASQGLNGGSYTVNFLNPTPTGVAWQYLIPVEAIGNIGNASKTLQALVTKTYDLSDSPISMRGNEAHSLFIGNSFFVDGRDYDHLTGALTAADPKFGIAVPSSTLEATVKGALSSSQRDNILGLGGTATDPSIGVTPAPPSSSVTSLADALCSAAPSSNKMSTLINDTLSIAGSTTFGTRTSPQIYCIDGLGTPGLPAVELKGSFSGVGALVVRNADLVALGNFKYEGLIIVTGDKVGFGMLGVGFNQDVYGSILINETSTDGSLFKELILEGNASVKRSQSALAAARQLIPASALSAIITTFPSSVQRVSWAEVEK